MKHVAFNINFDSFGEMYGFPENFDDRCFTVIADRFFELSRRYKFKYTIFIIGQDLERRANREAVKRWADEGHEIGNHSWSHFLNLGAMPLEEIRREVTRAHEKIAEVTGRAPRGFIAPGWSTSADLLKVLIELGYSYDTSAFPSWLLYFSVAKMLYRHAGGSRFTKIIRRKDWSHSLLGETKPYLSSGELRPAKAGEKGKIAVLPIPCNRYRVACWHTLSFVLGRARFKRLLQSCLRDSKAFYYLMHPGDLADAKDLDPSRSLRMERIRPSLEEKGRRIEEAMEIILADGRKVVTMEELAGHVRHD